MWFRQKDFARYFDSKRYRRDMAAILDGKELYSISERIDGDEVIIGQSGAFAVKRRELLLYVDGALNFRCRVGELHAWELAAHDAVMFVAPDLEHGGVTRSLFAFYSGWREIKVRYFDED